MLGDLPQYFKFVRWMWTSPLKLRYAKKAGTVSGFSNNPLSFTSINQSFSQSISQVIFAAPGYMKRVVLIYIKVSFIQIT